MLYNNNAPLVDIVTLEEVLGAMYGDSGVVIPFNTQTGEAVGEAQPAFLGRGKMIRPEWKQPANTRISALISLRYVDVGFMRMRQYAEECGLNGGELLMHLYDAKFDFDPNERQLGVIVWENAFAVIPFPRDMFRGAYDEIYGVEDGHQPRVYAGPGVVAYEQIEASLPKRGIFNLRPRIKPREA